MIPPEKPKTYEDVIRIFGDPRLYYDGAGQIGWGWEERILAYVHMPGFVPLSWDPVIRIYHFKAHRLIAPVLGEVFSFMHRERVWQHIKTFGGCYAFRRKRGTGTLSLHSWAIAVDFNPETNRLGEEGDMHPSVIQAFESHGFYWGGRFARPDPMHFEWSERGV